MSHNPVIHCTAYAQSDPGPAAIAYTVDTHDWSTTTSDSIGVATLLEAQYHALLDALELMLLTGYSRVTAYTSSDRLVRQLAGDSPITSPTLTLWRDRVSDLTASLTHFDIQHSSQAPNPPKTPLARTEL